MCLTPLRQGNVFRLTLHFIASITAHQNDFMTGNFTQLHDSLFQVLEKIKLQSLDLLENPQSMQEIDYSKGACRLNNYVPADTEYDRNIKNTELFGKNLQKTMWKLTCKKKSNFNSTTP